MVFVGTLLTAVECASRQQLTETLMALWPAACRLVEDADLRSAQDLFGGSDVSLDDFVPKSAKDFEQFGKLVSQKYLSPHVKSSHYKALLKALLKEALASLEVQQVKDVETSVAGIRADKVKEEKAKQASSKGELNTLCLISII